MANDLTPTTQLSEAQIALRGLSPGLRSLLELGDTASAIDHLANTPAMLREAKAALPALVTVATHPAGPDGVRRVLARREPAKPVYGLS